MRALGPSKIYPWGPGWVQPNGVLSKSWIGWPEAAAFDRPPPLKTRLRAWLGGWKGRRQSLLLQDFWYWVTDQWSNGFFHWMAEVLPKLEWICGAQALDETRPWPVLFPAMVGQTYAPASLAAFPEFEALFLAPGQAARVGSLHIAEALAPSGNYRPELMQRLRERLRRWVGSAAPQAGAGPGPRLFISRAKAPKRRLVDEEALWPALRELGYERLVLEEYSFKDQVSAVAGASVLAGVHGAGLTHMLALSPGARVIEIRRRGDTHNNCYFSLARALGLDYRYDEAEPAEGAGQDLRYGQKESRGLWFESVYS